MVMNDKVHRNTRQLSKCSTRLIGTVYTNIDCKKHKVIYINCCLT